MIPPYKSLISTQPRPPGLRFAPCKGIRTLESGKCSWCVKSGIREIQEMCSGILGYGIRNTAKRIRSPTNHWNPESSSSNPESMVRNPESKTVLDSLAWSYMNMVHCHSFLLLEAMSDTYSSDAQNAVVELKRLHPLS